MAVLDLLGRRWTLRILWELRDGDRPSFRELRARCGGISSSVLSERLRELREAGVLRDDGQPGYSLSAEGRRLLRALAPIESWAERWSGRVR
jgi:DNA-binding HxlR family transcriptional regulator